MCSKMESGNDGGALGVLHIGWGGSGGERRRPGGGGAKSILPFRSHKGEGGESVGCHLMRENEVAHVALSFSYSRAAVGGQRWHAAWRR
jgi:hypothetical protein